MVKIITDLHQYDTWATKKLLLFYEIPLQDRQRFYDALKSVSQGYASMNYEMIGYGRPIWSNWRS